MPERAGRVGRVDGIAEDLTPPGDRFVYAVGGDLDRHIAALKSAGFEVKGFASAQGFLEIATALRPGCVVLGVTCADDALAALRELQAQQRPLPTIVIGRAGDATGAVRAMKAGAVDWLEADGDTSAIQSAVAVALAGVRDDETTDRDAVTQARIAGMSNREREVLAGLMAGETNKSMARRLGLSPRTIEIHRARVMERLGARTLSEAILLASAAGVVAGPAEDLDGSD